MSGPRNSPRTRVEIHCLRSLKTTTTSWPSASTARSMTRSASRSRSSSAGSTNDMDYPKWMRMSCSRRPPKSIWTKWSTRTTSLWPRLIKSFCLPREAASEESEKTTAQGASRLGPTQNAHVLPGAYCASYGALQAQLENAADSFMLRLEVLAMHFAIFASVSVPNQRDRLMSTLGVDLFHYSINVIFDREFRQI